MTDWRQAVRQLVRAVEIERHAVLQRPVVQEDVVRGEQLRRLKEGAGVVRYSLSTSRWPALWGESIQVRVDPKGLWVSASVVSAAQRNGTQRFDVELETASSLGDVTCVDMRNDDATVLRLLLARLQEVGTQQSPIILRFALAITTTDQRTVVGQDAHMAGRVLAGRDAPWNQAQRFAVAQALGSEVSLIWGPPGTGKTDVVAAVIEGCYRQGHRVLFVAPTHVAVDQALVRVCERLEAEPDFGGGLVRRVRGGQLPELRERYGGRIDTDTTVSRLFGDLTGQVQGLRTEIQRLGEVKVSLRESATTQRLLDKLSLQHEQAVRAHDEAEKHRDARTARLADLTVKLKEARTTTGVSRTVEATAAS